MKTHRVIRVTGGRVAWKKSKSVPLPARTIEREIRALAKEIDLHGVVVHFKGGGYAKGGCAYQRIPSIANLGGLKRWQWRHLIIVNASWGWGDGWIHTLAHEAKHIEQFQKGRYRGGGEPGARAFANWWMRKRAAVTPEGTTAHPTTG